MTLGYPYPGVIVEPQGVSTSISITDSAGNTPTVYLDRFGVTTVSMPDTITARKTYFLPGEGPWTITPTANGEVTQAKTLTLEDGQVATVTVGSAFTAAQWAQLGAYVPRLAGTAPTAAPSIWIKAQDYGPVPNGGDISAALAAAFAALRTAGTGTAATGGIELPPGSYTITTSINATELGQGLVVKAGGRGSCHLTVNLSAAYPGIDFTGTSGVKFEDVYITGQAGGLQTAAVLFARSLGNGKGDNAHVSGLLVDGSFAQCPVAVISADLSSFRDSGWAAATAPCGLFVGTTDVLGVGSAYQSFATVTGNSICVLDNVTTGASSRSGILFSNGAHLFMRGVYCDLSGTGEHAIELIGSGGLNVTGDIRVESSSTAASQDVLYVNSSNGSSSGRLEGDWNLNGSTDIAVVRWGTNTVVSNYTIDGHLSNGAAGTVKFNAGTGTMEYCLLWNSSNLPYDSTPTSSIIFVSGMLQIPTALLPDGGVLAVKRQSSGDRSVAVGGDGQSGDAFFRAYRGGSTSEWLEILGASGGGSGINNQYTVDRVAASSAAERTINFRSSVNSGTSYAVQLQILPKGSVAVGLSNPGTTATDGFPYLPASAGAPTGTPTAVTGFVPMYYDTTNHKIWVYDSGAWKGVAVA